MTGKKTDTVIAIDIGNTRTHVGVVDMTHYMCLYRHDFLTANINRSMPDVLDEIKDVFQEFPTLPAVIGGKRGMPAVEAEDALLSCGTTSIVHVKHHEKLPVSFRYEPPSSLGGDRIAHALYATAVYPGRNVIIIASGTAITVDLVSRKREFLGGAILAGVKAQLKTLHLSTGALPLISEPAHPVRLPGTSTESCMQAGTAYGIAGALNLLVRKYLRTAEGACLILATGGAWHVTEGLVDFDYTAVPDLTLIGTALFK